MSSLSYPDLLHRLFPRLTGGIRWGLDRTRRLLAAVGDPHREYPVLHVGGTNGKGSVAAYLEASLRAGGLRTGLYTSPHLCTFRERIRLDGQPASERALVSAASALWPHLNMEEPTFFEATTVLALLVLARAEIDVAVVEVGLGGRLDATNVVEPEVVVITNVALDHAEYLGSTLESVAGEKAGILKAGVPAVTGVHEDPAATVIRKRASEIGAPLTVLSPSDVVVERVDIDGTELSLSTLGWGRMRLRTSLPGGHQALNAGLAVHALGLLPSALRPAAGAVRRGIAGARLPGRLQIERAHGRTWVFDVAHNPHAAAALSSAVSTLSVPEPVVALVGILADKDWSAILRHLAEAVNSLVLTVPPGAPAERRWSPETAAASLPEQRVEVVEGIESALERAGVLAGSGTVLVTGSFFTVGAALARLGLAPDGIDPPLPVADLPPRAREG